MKTLPKTAIKHRHYDAMKEVEAIFANALLKESPTGNSTDSSSFPQQCSPVISTPFPDHIARIKDGARQYTTILGVFSEAYAGYVLQVPNEHSISTLNIFAAPPSFEEAIEGLKQCGFSESANCIDDLRLTNDLEEGDKPLTVESAMGFVALMRGFSGLGEPMLGLFSEGTLSAEWRIADNKHLLIEPLDNERAAFAFIGPSKFGEKFRLNGRGTIAEVIDALRKHGVDQWRNV